MEFMAIEVLEGRAHTYRHDLESFFYVFIWVVIRYGRDRTKICRKQADFDVGMQEATKTADIKRSHMDTNRFKSILDEFPSEFDGLETLAKELRDILFPYWEGLFTGTYRGPPTSCTSL